MKTCSHPRIKAISMGFCPVCCAGAGILLSQSHNRSVTGCAWNYRIALFVFFKGLGQKEASLRLKEQRGKLNGIMATIDKLQQEIDDLRVQRQEVQSYLSDACTN